MATIPCARLLAACVLGLLLRPTAAFEQPAIHQLEAGERVLVLGDSTTADGLQPAGYVRLVDQAQREQVPELKLWVGGQGWVAKPSKSLLGERGLVEAVVKPAFAKGQGPMAVLINLGLNDQRLQLGTEQYTANLREGAQAIRALGATVILCTPTTMRGVNLMEPYAAAVRTLARELGCPVIDLHAAHVAHIGAHSVDGKVDPAQSPTRDACHLSGIGETLSARAVLQAFGLKPVWQQYQLRVPPVRTPLMSIIVEPALPTYPPGTTVTITATIKPGAAIRSWLIDATGAELTTTVVMDRHRVVELGFVRPR